MGVAVRSRTVAEFFTALLLADIRRAEEGEEDPTPVLLAESASPPPLFLAAPGQPPQLFPSMTYTPDPAVRARPVLTPDNYLEVVTPLLQGAQRSVWIEQQYIKARQPATAGS
jgi:hypothetical protein